MTTRAPTRTTSRSKARETATRLSSILHGYLSQKTTDETLAKQLRRLADWVEGEQPKPVAPSTSLEENEVFAHWQRVCDKPRAKYTAERRGKVKSRLREGYSVADIKRAIDGITTSGFHRGENNAAREYMGLELICQTGSKLESFMALSGGASMLGAPSDDQGLEQQITKATQLAGEQLKNGDNDGHNRTQQELRTLLARRGHLGEAPNGGC